MHATRHLTCLSDLGPTALAHVLDAADRFQKDRASGQSRPLEGKSVALIFEKASTRTRLSLEIAVRELGGHPVVLSQKDSQIGRGEPIADTARVLSRMVHAITYRTSSHLRLSELIQHSRVPVLNALTDHNHPMQLLADLQTIRRVRGKLQGLNYCWVGDGNNMANTWIEAAGLLKLKLRLACPLQYLPNAEELARARDRGGDISITQDPEAAVHDADVISTDVFTSMGQESEQRERLEVFAPFRVTTNLVERAGPKVMVLHCLPAHRGEEIDNEVLEGPRSFVWDQAEARLHTAKAALEWALTSA